MGLADRRAVREFQQKRLPDLRKEIDTAAGCEIPLEVEWDQLAVEGKGEWYMADDFWVLSYFRPLAAALSEITFDDLGREAVRDGLKKVVFTYDPASAPESDFTRGVLFADGVLTINFVPGVNVGGENSSYFTDRVYAIRKVLEAKF
jgi:hypothetical protein